MTTPRRTQFLMHPDEYRRLRDLARRKETSVGELVRTAVRAMHLEPQQPDRKSAVEAILQMKLPTIIWSRARKEIAASHARIP